MSKKNDIIISPNLQPEEIKFSQEQLTENLIAIDKFIEKSYLRELESASVIPLDSEKTFPAFRWFKITKIVYEKGVFFVDKFSMLFAALHKDAAQVVLALRKSKGTIDLYIGARDTKDLLNRSGETLEAALNGFLTGVEMEEVSDYDVISMFKYKKPSVACVSGVASLRDDKKEVFVQGLERLINSTASIPSYIVYFIADSISDGENQSISNALQQIYQQVSPFAVQQLSVAKGETNTISETISEGITKTIGETIGRTISNGTSYTETENHSKGRSHTDGTNSGWNFSYNRGGGVSLAPFGIGVNSNSGLSTGRYGGEQHSDATNEQTAKGSAKGKVHTTADSRQKTNQEAKNKGKAHGKAVSISDTKTTQITLINRHAQEILNLIDVQIKRLRNASPFGLWNCATYFISDNESTSRKLANIYRGTIVGEESGIETTALNSWHEDNKAKANEDIANYLKKGLNPRFKIDGQNVSAGTVVSSKELAIHMSLPQSSVPGIVVQSRASFGRNVVRKDFANLEVQENVKVQEDLETQEDSKVPNNLELGNVAFLGKRDEKNTVKLKLNDLTRHTFVTGTTGSGKSNAMYLLLSGIKEAGNTFLVIEPTKGEYKNIFGHQDGVNVFGSNPFFTKLLRINPFSFDYKRGIHVFEHVDRLVEIFNACWPMYAAMPIVLKKSILDAYKSCGWNLETSIPDNRDKPLFPTVNDVIVSLKDFIERSDYSADSKSDYKGALETRLVALTEGLTGLMLNSCSAIEDKKIFDENTIVDLSKVDNTETRSLVMGLLIMKLNEYRRSCDKMNSNLQHVTVIEEAHNILKRVSVEQSQEGANLIGKSVEMLTNSIAEMRTYGEGFIIVDQSPSQVDMSAIRNTNTKIILSLPEETDRVVVGKSIGLSDAQIEEIGRQKVGQAIIYQNDWEEAVQCDVKLYVGEIKPYKKQDNVPARDCALDYNLLSFLVSGRLPLHLSFDIKAIKENLPDAQMLSSLKYQIIQLINEYEQKGSCSIWKDSNFLKLSTLVTRYLNNEGEVRYFMKQKQTAPISELTNALADTVLPKFPHITKGQMLVVIQCLMRYQGSISTDLMNIYYNWISNFK
jgi:hypothetical protein